MSFDVFKVIRKDLEALEKDLQDVVRCNVDLLDEIGLHLVKSGGKRLRPALFLLSAKTGEYEMEKCLPLATSLELIHMASLVHDDVIDTSTLRRGAETANARFGNKVAILAGDFLFSLALKHVVGRGYREEISFQLADLVAELSMGEILQDTYAYQGNVSREDYFLRIEKKTANFLATACELGAILAGKDNDFVQGLKNYGRLLGMAFQIKDDLLDIVGQVEDTGKEKGSDIRQGIITLPVIRALEVSSSRTQLLSILTNKDMKKEMVEEVLALVLQTDAVPYAQNTAEKYLQLAKEALPKKIPAILLDNFLLVADFVGRREF